VIYNNVSTVLNAAVDDGHLSKNPCHAQSVRPPAAGSGRVVPWSAERVFAVRAALPERYRAMVDLGGRCGLRQGETFGLPVDAIGFDSGWLHIANQVKVTQEGLVFAPPKRARSATSSCRTVWRTSSSSTWRRSPPKEITLP
jgi:site-specific recombinase XerC